MSLPTEPTVEKVAPSKSKKEFLARLNLSENNEADRELYDLMKVKSSCKRLNENGAYRSTQYEAIQGRDRVNQNPESLVPQYQGQTNIHPPYEGSQITETAKHREILNIYRLSSERTRAYYDLGRYQDGPNEENWVIRWYEG